MTYSKPLEDRPIFQVELFDMGHSQGLAVNLPGRRRFAVRVKHDATTEGIVCALKALIDWIQSSPK